MPPSTVVVTTALEASAMSSTPSSSGGLSSAATSGIIAGCVTLVLTTMNEGLAKSEIEKSEVNATEKFEITHRSRGYPNRHARH